MFPHKPSCYIGQVLIWVRSRASSSSRSCSRSLSLNFKIGYVRLIFAPAQRFMIFLHSSQGQIVCKIVNGVWCLTQAWIPYTAINHCFVTLVATLVRLSCMTILSKTIIGQHLTTRRWLECILACALPLPGLLPTIFVSCLLGDYFLLCTYLHCCFRRGLLRDRHLLFLLLSWISGSFSRWTFSTPWTLKFFLKVLDQ